MRIAEPPLTRFILEILTTHGADAAQAVAIADASVWADRMGRTNHGAARLPILVQRITRGAIRCPCRPRFEQSAPGVGLLHGEGGSGHYLSVVGMREAVRLAREVGIGVVGVRDSNFFGAAGYYVATAAELGMVALCFSNSFPKVAAFGGHKPVLGTNPFAFAAPRQDGRALIVDMATSEAAGSTVRQQAAERRKLAPGVAVDAKGRPLTDARQLDEGLGALLPFGGARGYALGLMVEVLSGVLTGAGVAHGVASMYRDLDRAADNGHLFLAIDVERFVPLSLFHERMELLATALRASGPDGSVRLPGEARWQALEASDREGIHLDEATVRALEELARARSIKPPW